MYVRLSTYMRLVCAPAADVRCRLREIEGRGSIEDENQQNEQGGPTRKDRRNQQNILFWIIPSDKLNCARDPVNIRIMSALCS